jgi:alpha-galactosidase
MRKYGNMFRAGDCPSDALANRVRTLDIRLLCGATAAHSDMLIWQPTEPVESAALQFIAILFSVPQLSVMIDTLPPEHLEMTRFWLKFWMDNRDVLLDGELMPASPEILYPIVLARSSGKLLAAVYADSVVKTGRRVPPELIVVNGTLSERVVIEAGEDLGARFLEVRDCRGRIVHTAQSNLSAGLHAIAIPPAGVARLGKGVESGEQGAGKGHDAHNASTLSPAEARQMRQVMRESRAGSRRRVRDPWRPT